MPMPRSGRNHGAIRPKSLSLLLGHKRSRRARARGVPRPVGSGASRSVGTPHATCAIAHFHTRRAWPKRSILQASCTGFRLEGSAAMWPHDGSACHTHTSDGGSEVQSEMAPLPHRSFHRRGLSGCTGVEKPEGCPREASTLIVPLIAKPVGASKRAPVLMTLNFILKLGGSPLGFGKRHLRTSSVTILNA